MSVFKTTFSRALKVNPSDDANIPYPNLIREGLTTSTEVNKLIDSTAEFITDNVQPGDIVYNISTDSAATVIRVISQSSLELNADAFTAGGENYTIYQASSQTSNGNPGCYLYVGSAGNIKVTTVGQDIVTFGGVPTGTVLPIQVVKVHSDTQATKIIALW
jgi:hypothetical protein